MERVRALTCLAFASVAVSQGNKNPFDGFDYYINPSYRAELNTSIATCGSPQVCATLKQMYDVASAYWVDTKAKINGNTTGTVAGILADAAAQNPVPLVAFIVYDLPNRDCHAKASNGEICCVPNPDGTCDYDSAGDGTCSTGLQDYEQNYITPLATLFGKYPQVPIVAIIEPDSLPNLATNMGDPHCGNTATVTAYKTGVPFAVNTIASLAPGVSMYVDAAHGGWLGWPNNMGDFVSLVDGLNIASKIRGFSTNVANYQPIGIMCPSFDWCLNNAHPGDPCCVDPCNLSSQYNPSVNEHNYVLQLSKAFASVFDAHFVIDTGRSGVTNMRSDCANWCNIRGAGAGQVPTTLTNDTYNAGIDAYFWLKTPGESDGCTQSLPNGTQCSRFDSFCGSVDSIGSRNGDPRAPVAGSWFDYQVKMLASNANLGE